VQFSYRVIDPHLYIKGDYKIGKGKLESEFSA
jgi:hypothetical protein